MKAMSEILEEHTLYEGIDDVAPYYCCDGCDWKATQKEIHEGNHKAAGGRHQADMLKAEGYGRLVMGYPEFEPIIRDAWVKVDELREHSRRLALEKVQLAAENAELEAADCRSLHNLIQWYQRQRERVYI